MKINIHINQSDGDVPGSKSDHGVSWMRYLSVSQVVMALSDSQIVVSVSENQMMVIIVPSNNYVPVDHYVPGDVAASHFDVNG